MPLAHLLAPQIARKLEQVETDLGRAGYLAHSQAVQPGSPQGYLQTVGYEKTPYDSKGLTNKKDPAKGPQINYDHPVGAFAGLVGSAQRGGSGLQAFGKGLVKGSGLSWAKDDTLAIGDHEPGDLVPHRRQLIPNAPARPAPAQPGRGFLGVAPGSAIGQTENGIPVVAPAEPSKFDKRGRQIITLPADMQRINEYGEPIDKKGKRLAYLNSDPNLRYPVAPPDPNDPRILEHKFRGPLQDMQYDRRSGQMKFPADYFEGMSKREAQDIKDGVKALQTLDKGVSI